jgi:hypothetical protein
VPSDERTIAIADVIDRYISEHPNAADTPEGVRSWWLGRHRPSASLEDVRKALDHLVERGRLARVTLADGTTVYTRGVARSDAQALQPIDSADSSSNPRAIVAVLSAQEGRHGP